MVTILLQKILDLLKEKLGDIGNFIASFFISDPQDGQALIYDAELEKWVNDYIEPAIKETASGEVATFNTDVALPLIDAKFGIVASQEQGTPSPSSPKAITGYTGINVKHSGADTSDYRTYHVSWQTEAGTVYGGEVDVTSGKLTVTTKYFTFSEAQYYGTYGSDNANLYYVDIPDYITEAIKAYDSASAGDVVLLSNLFLKNSASGSSRMFDNQIRTQAGSLPTKIYFRADSFADLTAVNDFLENTPLLVVAELQVPVEYDLTPVEITALVGTNNIWGDTNGNAEVEYYTGAVKDIINVANIVYNLTSDLVIDYETIEEASCNVKAYRQGHMVIVDINNMVYRTTPTDTAVIITGLPKPVAAITSCVGDGYDLERCIRFRVNTDGELQQWYSRPYPNHNAQGQIIYITDEV